MAQDLCNSLLNPAVGNCLFRLVLIRCPIGERGNNQNQTVLNIVKCNFTLIFIVFTVLLEVGVYLADKRISRSLVRRSTVLQPAGVVVLLDERITV